MVKARRGHCVLVLIAAGRDLLELDQESLTAILFLLQPLCDGVSVVGGFNYLQSVLLDDLLFLTIGSNVTVRC